MNIWADDVEFIDIEVCAQAPYADRVDLARMRFKRDVMVWERTVLAPYRDNESRD